MTAIAAVLINGSGIFIHQKLPTFIDVYDQIEGYFLTLPVSGFGNFEYSTKILPAFVLKAKAV